MDISQPELLRRVQQLLPQHGRRYQKCTKVWAKRLTETARIATVTADGLETVNTGQAGDFLVKNQTAAQEHYVLSADGFVARYAYACAGADGWDVYTAKGQVDALELTESSLAWLALGPLFYFEAPWGEPMKAELGDFLATPLLGAEVYRIARREFLATYIPLTL